jgi:hypothetical protein
MLLDPTMLRMAPAIAGWLALPLGILSISVVRTDGTCRRSVASPFGRLEPVAAAATLGRPRARRNFFK